MLFKRGKDKIIQTAEKYIAKGKIDAAIKEYQKILQKNPNDLATLNRVGDLYVQLGKTDEAIKLYLKVAQAHEEDGFYTKAIAMYKKILKYDSSLVVVNERLAELYKKQGLIREAVAQYAMLVEAFLYNDRELEAISVLEKLVEIEPNDLQRKFQLAQLYSKYNQEEKALAQYREMAHIFLEEGHINEALKVYETAIREYPENLDFIKEVVLFLKERKLVGPAARLLSIAVSVNPEAEVIVKEFKKSRAEKPAAQVSTPVADNVVPEDAVVERSTVEEGSRVVDQEELVYQEEPELVREDEVEIVDEYEELPAAEEVPVEEGEGVYEDTLSGVELEVDVEEDLLLEEDVLAVEDEVVFEDEVLEEVEEESEEEVYEVEISDDIEWSVESKEDEIRQVQDVAQLEEVDYEARKKKEEEIVQENEEVLSEKELVASIELEEAVEEEKYEEDAYSSERISDLLEEARGFLKYGLLNKVEERVNEVLAKDDFNTEAISIMVLLYLRKKQVEKVIEWAERLYLAAEYTNNQTHWLDVVGKLQEAGFTIRGSKVLPPRSKPLDKEPDVRERVVANIREIESRPARLPKKSSDKDTRKETKRKVSKRLDDLVSAIVTKESKKGGSKPRTKKGKKADLLSSILGGQVSKKKSKVVEEKKVSAKKTSDLLDEKKEKVQKVPKKKVGKKKKVVDDLVADVLLGGKKEKKEKKTEGKKVVKPEAIRVDKEQDVDIVSEIKDIPTKVFYQEMPEAKLPKEEPSIFAQEDAMFDLAAELEKELLEEVGDIPITEVEEKEPTLDEIISSFKKGIAQHFSEEDYRTHFDLGIAYKEMGLLDEAISEFQIAVKSEELFVDSCSLLGQCFFEKGEIDLAIKWYKKALEEAKELPQESMLTLLYDLGNIYLVMGDNEAAYKTFSQLHKIDPNFEDIQEIMAQFQK